MSEERKRQAFLDRIKHEGRSSPDGQYWAKFTELLYQYRKDKSDRPPVPLILAASGESDQSKHERLAEQLDWAILHGCFEEAIAFLDNLPEQHWNKSSSENWTTSFFC